MNLEAVARDCQTRDRGRLLSQFHQKGIKASVLPVGSFHLERYRAQTAPANRRDDRLEVLYRPVTGGHRRGDCGNRYSVLDLQTTQGEDQLGDGAFKQQWLFVARQKAVQLVSVLLCAPFVLLRPMQVGVKRSGLAAQLYALQSASRRDNEREDEEGFRNGQ